MSLKLEQLNLQQNKADRNRFINLAWKLYKEQPNWVPMLRIAQHDMLKEGHPFYESSKTAAWVCVKDGEDVGRIMAIHNKAHNTFQEENVGFFGFFESINDQEVADSLLNIAQEFLKNFDVDTIRGPVQLSTNYECGLLIDGFDDPPQIMMTYNPRYYQVLLENWQLTKAMDLVSFYLEAPFKMPEIIERVATKLEKSNNVTYRKVSKKDWNNEVKIISEIYNDAWEKNWGFIPMSDAEFQLMAKDMKEIVDEDLLLFVLVDGVHAGFILSLPDYNQIFQKIPNGKLLPTGIFKLLFGAKKISRFRTITMGIKQSYRKLGLDTLLYYQSSKNLLQKPNYKSCEMGWVLESNKGMTKPLERMSATVAKTYRIFEKQVSK